MWLVALQGPHGIKYVHMQEYTSMQFGISSLHDSQSGADDVVFETENQDAPADLVWECPLTPIPHPHSSSAAGNEVFLFGQVSENYFVFSLSTMIIHCSR